MRVLLTSLMVLSAIAYADLDSGRYLGTDNKGLPCEIFVGDVSFENGIKHPLNERVQVVVQNVEWTLSHPKVVDEESGKVRFNHNYFEATVSSALEERFGAQYLKMTIDHDAEPHRPTQFLLINDDYRDASRSTKVECKGLVKL